MKKELLETLSTLMIINEKLQFKVIQDKEFLEQENTIYDFVKKMEDLKIFLQELELCDLENKELLYKKITELHLYYINIIWNYEQMHELVKKVMCEYKL